MLKERHERTPQSEKLPDSTVRRFGSEAVRYASEHSRPIESREKYEALGTLRELGVLKSLADIETYHGRYRTEDGVSSWEVNPYFQNGGNATGNRNVFAVPVLYTADLSIAEDFARTRAFHSHFERTTGQPLRYHELDEEQRRQYLMDAYAHAEVHKIISRDIDASIVSWDFSFGSLTEEERNRYVESMRTLFRRFPLSEGTPLPIDTNLTRGDIDSVLKTFSQKGLVYVTNDIIDQVSQETGIAPDDVSSLASVVNARNYVWNHPWKAGHAIQSYDRPTVELGGTDTAPYPVSIDYIARFFKEHHIVGQESGVRSATLRRDITIVSLFNLREVNTVEAYDRQRQEDGRALLPIGKALGDKFPRPTAERHKLFNLLEGAYVSPTRLIDAAKEVPGFDRVLEASAGNWEGYSLEEHTATTLENFDENFAERVPVELLAPMRLALLTHDLGKPVAVARGEKHRQKSYNKLVAQRFFAAIGLNPEAGNFIRNLTGDGMSLATEVAVFGRDEYCKELRQFAASEVARLVGESSTEDMVDGYLEMCEMLVTCDGGAYTQMAVTNRKGNGTFRNFRSFDDSFISPTGLGRRDLRLKSAGIAKRSRKSF